MAELELEPVADVHCGSTWPSKGENRHRYLVESWVSMFFTFTVSWGGGGGESFKHGSYIPET